MSLPTEAAALGDPMREALVILGSIAVVIPLFHRLRLSPVLGYMILGLVIGPFGLGALAGEAPWLRHVTISDHDRIEPMAELGVALLMFMIGLEMSWERIAKLRRLVFGLGAAQVAGCTAVLGAAAWSLGTAPAPAVVAGLALAMSSTAIVTQVLSQERRVTSRVGRTSLAVLLFQDLAVVPILFLLGLLAHQGGGPGRLLWAVAQAVAAIAALAALGRLGLRPLFRGVARTGSPELFVAACLLVVLATGLAAAAAGLSMALGALIAGVLLAETEYRRQVEVTVEPFKGLLLGVFLISVGLSFDLGRIAAAPLAVVGAAVGLVALKTASIFALARLFGVRWPVALQSALLLGPGGEFSFVIIGLAASMGLLPPGVAGTGFVAAALSMAAIPALSHLGRKLAPPKADAVPAELLPPAEPGAAGVIIAGFGRVGRTVAAMLDRHAIGYIALDSDVARVAESRAAGAPVYYGDVTQPELLRRVGLGTARGLVVTIDDRDRADQIVQVAREERPDLLIVVRARDARHAAHLYLMGATDAVPETIEASLQLSEAVLVDLGVPMGPVLVSIHEQRARFQAEIKAMAPEAEVRPLGRSRLRRALIGLDADR
ncbi:MAG TPA: cation:proton antiporter [Acetobacteraceae bacterium]|nr:cation:proton antiporter [Acetobacteraceae bacterium]